MHQVKAARSTGTRWCVSLPLSLSPAHGERTPEEYLDDSPYSPTTLPSSTASSFFPSSFTLTPSLSLPQTLRSFHLPTLFSHHSSQNTNGCHRSSLILSLLEGVQGQKHPKQLLKISRIERISNEEELRFISDRELVVKIRARQMRFVGHRYRDRRPKFNRQKNPRLQSKRKTKGEVYGWNNKNSRR